MNKRALTLIVVAALAALGFFVYRASQQHTPSNTPVTPPATTSQTPANTTPTAPVVPVPASESTSAAKPAAGKPEAASSEDSALERAAALPAAATLPAGKWVAGTHYRPLVPAQPTDAAPGKVEVIEMFWYACPHCYALDPYLETWRKSKAAYIEFRRVPVTWGEVHRAHARLFYTLQALGKEEALHSTVFAEMHDHKNYLFAQNDEHETIAAQVAFAKAHGISESDFMGAYNSFTVQTNLQKADDLVHRFKVEGVPLMVINGKYLTDVNMAGSPANVISIVNDLAASEKRR